MAEQREEVGGIKLLIAFVVLAGVAILFSWSAFHVWRGALHASGSDGVPGRVTEIVPGGTNSQCSGRFTSDHGRIRDRAVVVEPNVCEDQDSMRGRFVEGIEMGPIDGPNSKDTVYVRDGAGGYWTAYLIAVLLSICAVVTGVPALLVTVSWPLSRLRDRGGRGGDPRRAGLRGAQRPRGRRRDAHRPRTGLPEHGGL